MSDNLIVRQLAGGRRWVENRSGFLFGVYRWRDAPTAFVIFGKKAGADTIFEIGFLGRIFWVAPRP